MTIQKFTPILVALWMAGCGAAVPFEKTHFKPVATKGLINSGNATYQTEVPKGYVSVDQSRVGDANLRWEYRYADSSLFYVARAGQPDNPLQNAVAYGTEPEAGTLARNGVGDNVAYSGQDERGRYWMERQVEDMKVGYRNVKKDQVYLFNYAVDSFQRKF